jgi:hypothetical protein
MNQLDVCLVCNQPMLAVEPNQITHPCCDPDDTPLLALSVEEINQLIGDQGWCRDCGEPIRESGFTKMCSSNHRVMTP